MIKKGFILLLLLFQLHSVLGQQTLKQIINKTTLIEGYYSPFYYSDQAGEKQGFSIQEETQLLKRLKLEPLEYAEYHITGKYEINDLTVLFFSEYWDTEDVHFALLLDKSLHIIDRLDKTAYDNAEGFYGVRSSIAYNIITRSIYNIYNNPEYITKKYTITNKGFKPIKDEVIIKTPSGIRVRNKPTTNSDVVTSAPNLETFDYLSKDYDIDSTSVIDNGKYLKGYWLKIAQKDSTKQLGYVFNAFTKRHMELTTNEYKIRLDEISKEDFEQEESRQKNNPSEEEKITDTKEIKNILKGQIIEEYQEEYDSYVLKKIITDNKKEIGTYLDECGITAYYPKYRYLLLECGHSSDYLINLKNGKDDINRIGNPDYYLPSPKNTFRLNGYYSGQSNIHFLEKNNKNAPPEYMFHLSTLIPLDYMEKFFWKNDTTMFLKIEGEYYKIKLQKL